MKIKAIKTIYFLPRISDGEYSQEEIDQFLASKISEGEIFNSEDGCTFYSESDEDHTEWSICLPDDNFEILEV